MSNRRFGVEIVHLSAISTNYNHYKDGRINYFSKEKVNGYKITKVVSSYSSGNEEFIRIDFNNVVVSVRLYSFTITYPAFESETCETIFKSVLDSIEFTKDK